MEETMQVSRQIIARLSTLIEQMDELLAEIGCPYCDGTGTREIEPAFPGDTVGQQPPEEAVYDFCTCGLGEALRDR